MNDVTIAILVKDKETVLKNFLHCIYNQTYDKKHINLYIRTNDNKDKSEEILTNFIDEHRDEYKEIYYNSESVDDNLKQYDNHEWNTLRFKILGEIRQDSVNWALSRDSFYFVVDVDNFIMPDTLQHLINVNLPVISPMLMSTTLYSNFHAAVDINGYFANSDHYRNIYYKNIKGIIEMPVVHCTYLINKNILNEIIYDDGSNRYEYVIFSDVLRKKNIPQYLDNRYDYGIITFWVTSEEMKTDIINCPYYSDFFSKYIIKS